MLNSSYLRQRSLRPGSVTLNAGQKKKIIICVQRHSKLGNACFTILFNSAYFSRAVMVEGDESSRLREANQPEGLASYRP